MRGYEHARLGRNAPDAGARIGVEARKALRRRQVEPVRSISQRLGPECGVHPEVRVGCARIAGSDRQAFGLGHCLANGSGGLAGRGQALEGVQHLPFESEAAKEDMRGADQPGDIGARQLVEMRVHAGAHQALDAERLRDHGDRGDRPPVYGRGDGRRGKDRQGEEKGHKPSHSSANWHG